LASSLFLFLMWPTLMFYLSINVGIKIPYVGDLLLVVILVINLFSKSKINKITFLRSRDVFFGLALLSLCYFTIINFNNIFHIISVNEIRYPILIVLVYFIFRFSVRKRELEYIKVAINLFLKWHTVIILLEFLVVNFLLDSSYPMSVADLFGVERVYESTAGFVRPVGFLVGASNASIGVIIYLFTVNKKDKFLLFTGLISLLLTFTLTAFLCIMVCFMLYSKRSIIAMSFCAILLSVTIYYQASISSLRTNLLTNTDNIPTGLESLYYYTDSLLFLINNMQILPQKVVFEESFLSNLYGDFNEVYFSRMIAFYGLLFFSIYGYILVLYVRAFFNNKIHVFLIKIIPVLIIVVASFHYPAICSTSLFFIIPFYLQEGGHSVIKMKNT